MIEPFIRIEYSIDNQITTDPSILLITVTLLLFYLLKAWIFNFFPKKIIKWWCGKRPILKGGKLIGI